MTTWIQKFQQEFERCEQLYPVPSWWFNVAPNQKAVKLVEWKISQELSIMVAPFKKDAATAKEAIMAEALLHQFILKRPAFAQSHYTANGRAVMQMVGHELKANLPEIRKLAYRVVWQIPKLSDNDICAIKNQFEVYIAEKFPNLLPEPVAKLRFRSMQFSATPKRVLIRIGST